MTGDFIPWPCNDLTQYPLDEHWTDTFPQIHLPRWRYEYIQSATRRMFQQPEMNSTYAFFRNYAFQQGNLSNANMLDMEFFYNVLSHDYPFFLGHKRTEIQADVNFSDKKYEGLGVFRASHFDLYRVEQSAPGFATLQSMTNPGNTRAFVPVTERPHKGDYIFARLMPIGIVRRMMAPSVLEPWDTVDPRHVDAILAVFRRQYEAFCNKFPETSTRAFMKICAYHFYELIQAHELIPILNDRLGAVSDFVHAQTVSYTFTDVSKMPRLASIPGAKLVKEDGKEIATLATVPICTEKCIPETLREAIVSRDNRTLEVTMFMHDAGEKFLREVFEPLFKKAKIIQKIHVLDDNETYRSLRHLSISKAE